MRGGMLTVALVSLLSGCSCEAGADPHDGSTRLRDAAPIERRDAGEVGRFEDPSAAPPLDLELLALTYAGGAGDQFVRSVGFTAEGRIVGEGTGFRVEYDADGTGGAVLGDASTADGERFDARPRLPADPGAAVDDPRVGLTYRVGYRQAGSNQQLPIFRAFSGDERLWALWAHAVADVQAAGVTADTRCYQAWLMPSGHVGVQCWTDGGNSVLAKEPRDLSSSGWNPSWAAGSYQNSAGGMSTSYALVDPEDGGRVVSGTFVASHVAQVIVDPWGRVIVGSTATSRSGGAPPSNPFGQADGAGSGFLVLSSDLRQVLANVRIGGACSGSGTQQAFGSLALEDGVLVLGGTSCAPELATRRAAQSTHGGGQDGILAIVRLYR